MSAPVALGVPLDVGFCLSWAVPPPQRCREIEGCDSSLCLQVKGKETSISEALRYAR